MTSLIGSFAPGQFTPADYASRRLASGEDASLPADQRVAAGSDAGPETKEAALSRPVQPGSESVSAKAKEKGGEEGPPKGGEEELTESEEREVQQLKQRDREVRAHEQAHATVGGSYASAPSYEFSTGPDGKKYAVGGEVQIDASPVADNPKATIRKMDIVIRAALAPAEPSSQDQQVARQAQQTRAKAQAELSKSQDEESQNGGKTAGSPGLLEAAETAYQDALGRAKSPQSDVFELAGAIFSAQA